MSVISTWKWLQFFLFVLFKRTACVPHSDFTKHNLHVAERENPGLRGKHGWVPISAVLTRSEGKFSNFA